MFHGEANHLTRRKFMPHKQKENNECNSKCYYVEAVFFPYLCKRGFIGDYDTPMF
jgi:hypothetical protein